ncbi:DUF983 domain-containing protein [Arenibaculum pallidiluteum]|uniref:DUF983 domain-containing protein n=1 Tax=Arenibaculum pallidiluteum TaxID=2812559 RepID=UPI001A979583|nr:DUF983 domain-containing protein [Arenibaculum pallidiluteum]
MTGLPNLFSVLVRGLVRSCPNCGKGRLFRGYLKVAETCPACGTEFGRIRADDLPPYLTIFVVGHIIVPMALWGERAGASTLFQMTVWPLATLVLTLAMLPCLKGAVVGLMWSMGMRGDEQR